jgi:hypothetical protein
MTKQCGKKTAKARPFLAYTTINQGFLLSDLAAVGGFGLC